MKKESNPNPPPEAVRPAPPPAPPREIGSHANTRRYVVNNNPSKSRQRLSGLRLQRIPPDLRKLQRRKCNNRELQSALVFLINQYNKQGIAMEEAIHDLQDGLRSKPDKPWTATL